MNKVKKLPVTGYTTLPNGCTIFWEQNEVGGRRYYSDECGITSLVWDTSITDESTLLAAMTQEAIISINNRYWADQNKKK